MILCGDLNVAHEEIDIKNPKTNRHNAGFTDEERAQFSNLLNAGFTDTFRYLYPEEVKYSWWSYRFQARQKNAGWRIDYFVISDRLRPHPPSAFLSFSVISTKRSAWRDLEYNSRKRPVSEAGCNTIVIIR